MIERQVLRQPLISFLGHLLQGDVVNEEFIGFTDHIPVEVIVSVGPGVFSVF